MKRVDDYPEATRINDHGFYVGCHQSLDRASLDYIVEVMHDYYNGGLS